MGGVMVKMLDYFVLTKFELQIHYHAHYLSNPLGKIMNPLLSLTLR